jgi:hypothetical protein
MIVVLYSQFETAALRMAAIISISERFFILEHEASCRFG